MVKPTIFGKNLKRKKKHQVIFKCEKTNLTLEIKKKTYI